MKKVLIVVLCAISLGGGMAYYLFNKVVIKNKMPDTVMVRAFQIGAFSNYENANRVAVRNNGIIVPDEDIYRVYVAILYDNEALNKVKDYYQEIGLNYYLKEITVDDSFIESIKLDEEMIIKSDKETYSVLNSEILKKYKEMYVV